MFSHKFLYTLPLLFLIAGEKTCSSQEVHETTARSAAAQLVSGQITGSVVFTETNGGLRVNGLITGLAPGHYGFHIHELGDVTTCDTTGAHFNPEGTNHGGRDHAVRHVGDLGNVEFAQIDDTVVAYIDFTDDLISLRGSNSILGRAVVLHEQADDLGLGNHETSLTTGNAGARVACGTIGIRSPAEPWNSGISIIPSAILLIAGVVFAYL